MLLSDTDTLSRNDTTTCMIAPTISGTKNKLYILSSLIFVIDNIRL